jgi:hypothetical protein
MERITVIKATKRKDLWDFNKNIPIKDTTPIGFTMTVDGAVPESYIKWVPNKIFDKRKYPELYALFGKDHLPNDIELKCFVQKHWEEWNTTKKKFNPLKIIFLTILSFIGICCLGIFGLILMR